MGESDAQRLELIGQLAELGPTEVPINFLDPRPGTPLAVRRRMRPLEALRWIALFRLGLPSAILRFGGGRETTLGELQAMGMIAGVNALIVGNYLTTLGRSPGEDLAMLADLGMPVGPLSPGRTARPAGLEPTAASGAIATEVATRPEPLRHCPMCGRRMAVVVTPTSWRARCRDHGQFDGGA